MNGSVSQEAAPEPGDLPRSDTGRSTIRDHSLAGNWKQRNLLSLDGGGIRGYWSLLVLERLMQAIGDEERSQSPNQDRYDSFYPEPFPDHVTQCEQDLEDREDDYHLDAQKFLPCHYFDLICGSSTGRFRMTVKDCLVEYRRMGQQIFGKPRLVSQRNIGIVRWPKYSATSMQKAFQEVTQRRGEKPAAHQPGDATPLLPTVPGTCCMFAPTNLRIQNKEVSSKRLHLIRSYDHLKTRRPGGAPTIVNFGKADSMWIWEVARAATAAPMYFAELPYKLNSGVAEKKYFFSDGGFGSTNNPTSLGIQELEAMHGRSGVGVIVSVGTARADADSGKRSIFHRIKEGFHTATDPNTVADMVRNQERPHYWRLNDNHGIKLELDDWKPNGFLTPLSSRGKKTLLTISQHFDKWVAVRENQKLIGACARELVARRLLRSQDGDKWYRFANGATNFTCKNGDCLYSAKTREEFLEHWQEIHEDCEDAHSYEEPDFVKWSYPPRESLR